MPDALALSIDEANKIRLAMGMAPLPGGSVTAAPGPTFKPARGDEDSDEEPASTIDTRQAAAYDNFRKVQEEAEAKKKKQAKLDLIKKDREKAARNALLEGKGLADEAGEEDDLAWLKGTKKRQKKLAKVEQMRREQEERERQALEALQYTENDLAGVKVGHELKDFDDGDQILVLKDTAVDEDEDDELEAVALKEKERLQERLDSKKRKRAYDPNDMDEGGQKSILAQYDEEIDGKKRKAFTLNGQGRTVEELQQAADEDSNKFKRMAFSLDILKDDAPINDYMDVSEIKVKKPKKKKSKSSRRKHIEEEEDMIALPTDEADENAAMDVDEPDVTAPKRKKKLFEGSFVDDDDLQATLAAQRQKALKNRKKMRPEDIARQLREEASATPNVRDSTDAEEEESGLVIDETTEFVQNLKQSAEEEEEENQRRRRATSARSSVGFATPGNVQHSDEEGDIDMAESYAAASERDESRVRSVSVDANNTGLDAEETVGTSVGAALKLLKQRGILQETDSGSANALYREQQKFLADRQKAEELAERQAKEQRERERTSGRWSNMNTREREEWARKNNADRDRLESRKMAEIFNKEYKPTFNLTYVDEHGRTMNQKEAFKQLSHQFHGKGSGNTKTQKHLDKITAEKKRMAESSLETNLSGGMSTAQDQQAKKHKQAGVRLQ